MPTTTGVTKNTLLFSYVIASADMRYIERSEREIYLRYVEQTGPVVRGEMPDCGPRCHANLGQILLEYVMSCEGCKDNLVEADMARGFGQRLGKSLAKKLSYRITETDEVGRLQEALRCALHSLDVPFTTQLSSGKLQYQLESDPIAEAARTAGVGRGQPMARRALIAMLETLTEALLPGWHLQLDSVEFDQPLDSITIAKVDE